MKCRYFLMVDFVRQGCRVAVLEQRAGMKASSEIGLMMDVLRVYWNDDGMDLGVRWVLFVLVVIAGCGLWVESSLAEGVEGYNGGKC